MARTKGAKNKKVAIHPLHTAMSVEERLEFIASLIVEHIESDQTADYALLKKIGGQDEPSTT